jgi:predicted component of type VI protein secretion system
VVIPEYSISKRHCTFELGDGTMAIRDAGSTNGTLLNGSALAADAPVPLCGGEIITMGRFRLVYETPAGFLELVSGLVK